MYQPAMLVYQRFSTPENEDFSNPKKVSNEINPGWLGYIGDYTTQVYGDSNIANIRILINQSIWVFPKMVVPPNHPF